MKPMQYNHTQNGYWHWVLYAVILAEAPWAWVAREDSLAVGVMAAVAVVLALAALTFQWMTVRDEGEALAIRFGPLPLFRKRIPYTEITAVEPARTSILDGWGIHYIPGRGWTYNVWGFDCARLNLGNRIVRIGSDDVENLVRFLRERIRSSAA